MEPRSASPRSMDPDASEFVRFCYRRRRVGWPELYDEMCAVAARGLYRGMGTDDLAALGIGFSLFDMAALAALAGGIVAEEQAKRRPVAVAIVAEDPPLDLGSVAEGQHPATADVEDVTAHVLEPTTIAHPAEPRVIERTFDVPVRLVPLPAGA